MSNPNGPNLDDLPSGDTMHGSRKRLDLADLPSEEEQERRWEQDICVMCGVEPIAGESVAARYCGPECRQHMTALRQKAQRLGLL